MRIDWWRLGQVIRLAIRPAPSIANWAGWWPQLGAVALWITGLLGVARVEPLHLGVALGAALLMAGVALLLLVAAYRLQPSSEQERRLYAEHFLHTARWR